MSHSIRQFLFRHIFLMAGIAVLTSCSAVSTVTTVANIALEASGLKKPDVPELPDAQKPPSNIAIRLHAGGNLNADSSGRPFALVARIYKLKQNAAFQQAPYEVFLTPQKEKDLLGADLLEVKEITLIPGQKYEAIEKVSKEAYFIGVVALFHSPAPQRWRAVFTTKDVEKTGITVGIHACALTVGIGKAIDDNGDPSKVLSPVTCQ